MKEYEHTEQTIQDMLRDDVRVTMQSLDMSYNTYLDDTDQLIVEWWTRISCNCKTICDHSNHVTLATIHLDNDRIAIQPISPTGKLGNHLKWSLAEIEYSNPDYFEILHAKLKQLKTHWDHAKYSFTKLVKRHHYGELTI